MNLICSVELSSGLAIAYVALLIMAIIPIFWGSHLSLDQRGMESMSTEDAWKFPFVGSAVLFGLYLLFKVFSKDLINMLLTSYFLFFGILAVTASIKPFFSLFMSKPKKNWEYSFTPFWQKNSDPFQLSFNNIDIVACIFATFVGIWYVVANKHWIANNILGLAFSIQGIALLSLGSYKIGCILLSGLFIYDIFWVFGTDVMVTVAKSFDAPVKLLFPKDLFAQELSFSMLGLGDIVIPGIFIALLLRFDMKQSSTKKKGQSKTYFYSCFIGYLFGLVATVFVMHTFQAAQPALLYLVPACIGSSFFVAFFRGELTELLSYTEEQGKNTKKE